MLNDMGTFNGQFDLSDAAPLGTYSMQATLPDGEQSFSASFQVAEYRKPQFEVTIDTDKPGVPAGREDRRARARRSTTSAGRRRTRRCTGPC